MQPCVGRSCCGAGFAAGGRRRADLWCWPDEGDRRSEETVGTALWYAAGWLKEMKQRAGLLLCSVVRGRKVTVGSVGLNLEEWLLRGKGTKNPEGGGPAALAGSGEFFFFVKVEKERKWRWAGENVGLLVMS